MPLVRTPSTPEYDEARNMIGIWMRDPRIRLGPVDALRVFVTLEALWQLEPSKARNLDTAIDAFERHRGKIELAASRKFDDRGPEESEEYHGRPVIVLTTYEFSQLPRD